MSKLKIKLNFYNELFHKIKSGFFYQIFNNSILKNLDNITDLFL